MKPQVIVITGAFGALGRVLARTLATQGHRMALLDAAPNVPADLAAEFAPHLLLPAVDLSQRQPARQAMATIVAHHGRVHALVNIAGGFRWETVAGATSGADDDADTWDQLFSMNLKTALNACRALLPTLLAAGEGRIVNIGAAGAARAAAGMGAYAASKSAVLRLTEALSEEVRDRGVRVNAVLPSIIDTPANRREMPDADASRWVAPEALADVVAFLLSDASRAIHGAGIVVSGRV